MASGIRYRGAGIIGTAIASVTALLVANLPPVQRLVASLPVLDPLRPTTMSPEVLPLAVGTVLVVQLLALSPLFKPRPRRILDTIMLTQRRVLLATFVLAAVGYFDYTYRLPRTTLVVTTLLSLVTLPLLFVTIGRRVSSGEASVIIAGDDPQRIAATARATDSVVGYVAPNPIGGSDQGRSLAPDGGTALAGIETLEIDRLGGLSRLDEILVQRDVDEAKLAFVRSDRGEFFGTLEACQEHGVTATVHRDHADSVLTSPRDSGAFVRVRLDPIDWQDHVIKRLFDATFAATTLLALLPAMVVIAVAVKLDDPGPVFYRQERTAALGQTFTVYKFRTMRQRPASEDPAEDDDRVTRVGRVLRTTHLDEIPQLWSIFVGEMSVVGPRAAWTDEEAVLESDVPRWRKRWFVKPGLTGLAQINEATSTEPRRKLRYDVEYIRRQSFAFDCKIVVRQLWSVGEDVVEMLRGESSTESG